MLLYHFTAREWIASIMAEGLTKGQVPVTPTSSLNAVWLTDDKNASGHGLTDGYVLSPEQCVRMGVPSNQGFRFPNKRAIRITVVIPRGDRALVSWTSWGRKRLTADWYATLDSVGGNKSRSWFLYWEIIPPEWIREVVDLQPLAVDTIPSEAAE